MNISKYIDHTFLKPAGEKDAVRKLCREAKKAKFASVCVNPCEVALAAKLLKGSTVKVCTVIGFPLGANTTEVKLFEVLDVDEDIEGAIVRRENATQIRNLSLSKGMKTLREDGWAKVFKGVTSVKEIIRVTEEQ